MTKPPGLLSLILNFSQRLTVRHRGKEEEDEAALSPHQQMRERISRRAALEFHDGMYGILAQTNIFDFCYKGMGPWTVENKFLDRLRF